GHGESSAATADAYTVEAQADTLAEFLDQLGVKQVDMAGNSMGGGITAYFASRYPERVNSIALFGPAGSDRYPSKLDEALAEGQNPLVVRESGDFDRLMDFVLEKRPFLPWPIADVMEEKAIERRNLNDQIFQAIMSSAKQLDLETILPAIRAPALIVWGREDRVLAPENARVFAKGIDNAQVVLLDGVGHVPMVEVPEASADIWQEFLEQYPAQ
ncbi:MAG: alpha/beta fold hydrolase, partial [Marinobacter sp.]